VSLFVVHEDFTNIAQLSYDGKPQGEKVGRHAMVLIGAREEVIPSKGVKRWFLLQNWWSKKQFVEVSDEYLEACEATVYFVKTRQTEIPSNFPIQHQSFAENDGFDQPEGLPMEFIVPPLYSSTAER
jgi:hypothetical protein